MMLTPKNWSTFQHYKDRKPTWIKLHHDLLDDYEFSCLPDASRALAPCLWLLASEYEGGKITANTAEISFRLRLPEERLLAALTPLIEKGFFIASDTLAPCYRTSIPEKEIQVEKQEEEEVGAKAPTPRRTKTPFPTDWNLQDGALLDALERGMTQERAVSEFQRFRDHALAHDRRQKDWPAAWRNWVTSPFQRQTQQVQTRKDQKADEWDAARAKLRASIERDLAHESETVCGSAVRLLSPVSRFGS
jgi:hypothetical protein